MSMVYCRSCGHQVHETVRFCPDCGASQTSSSSIQDSISQTIKKSDFPPITEFIFSTKGRVTRSQLWIAIVVNFIIQITIFQMAKSSSDDGYVVFGFIYTAAIIYPAIVLLIKRCHDLGFSGKYLWLCFLGIPLLIILFGQSDGENIYDSRSIGAAPKNINPSARDDSPTPLIKSDDSIANEHSIIDDIFDNKLELSADNFTNSEQASRQINQTTINSTQTPAKKNILTELMKLGLVFLLLGLGWFSIYKFLDYENHNQLTTNHPEDEPVANNDGRTSGNMNSATPAIKENTNVAMSEKLQSKNSANYQIISQDGAVMASKKKDSRWVGISQLHIAMNNRQLLLFKMSTNLDDDAAELILPLIPSENTMIEDDHCSYTNAQTGNSDIMAEVKYLTVDQSSYEIIRAWRIDAENKRFIPLGLNHVKCDFNSGEGDPD